MSSTISSQDQDIAKLSQWKSTYSKHEWATKVEIVDTAALLQTTIYAFAPSVD